MHTDVTVMIQQIYNCAFVLSLRPFTFSPLSGQIVMGPELTVAVSVTVVVCLLLTLRRFLKVEPVVQFWSWISDCQFDLENCQVEIKSSWEAALKQRGTLNTAAFCENKPATVY